MEVIDDKLVILETLGKGGSGVVYRCWHNSLGKEVAVKVLISPESTSVERFKSEGRLLSSLSHPGLVVVLSFGLTSSGNPYFVMEKIDGKSLGQLLQDGPLSPPRLKTIILQVLEALEYAHTQGVVHRDIKPSNILIVGQPPDEKAVLVDFGIMKLLADDNKLTKTNALLGTPSYMSPEQCLGQKVDQRSDIYSLGCTIYECALGRLPFEGSGYDVMLGHLHNQPELMPAQLAKFLAKCLDKNPDLRYQSAAEAAHALRAIDLDDTSFDIVDGARALRSATTPQWKSLKILVPIIIILLTFIALSAFFFMPPSKPPAVGRRAPSEGKEADIGILANAIESRELGRAEIMKQKLSELPPSEIMVHLLFRLADEQAKFDPANLQDTVDLAAMRARELLGENDVDLVDHLWRCRAIIAPFNTQKAQHYSNEMLRILHSSTEHAKAAGRAAWLAEKYRAENDIPAEKNVLEVGIPHAVQAGFERDLPVDLHVRYMYLLRLGGEIERVVALGKQALEVCRKAREKNNIDTWIAERQVIQSLLSLVHLDDSVASSIKDDLITRKFSSAYNRIDARIHAGEICIALKRPNEALEHYRIARADSMQNEVLPRSGQFYALHAMQQRNSLKTKAEQETALNEEMEVAIANNANIEYRLVAMRDVARWRSRNGEYARALRELEPAIELSLKEALKRPLEAEKWRTDAMRIINDCGRMSSDAHDVAAAKRFLERMVSLNGELSAGVQLEMKPSIDLLRQKIADAEKGKK